MFAGDAESGERIARRIEAGTVAVNDVFMTNYSVLGLPMGGWKKLRDRLPPRRRRDPQVLPLGVDHGAPVPPAEARSSSGSRTAPASAESSGACTGC